MRLWGVKVHTPLLGRGKFCISELLGPGLRVFGPEGLRLAFGSICLNLPKSTFFVGSLLAPFEGL